MSKRYSYFKSELTDLFVICDELHEETFSGMDDEYNCIRIVRKLNTLTDENEQLKQELIEFKKWGEYVGDVRREDVDKVFKMSIYEIAEAFVYYEKRIKELEE